MTTLVLKSPLSGWTLPLSQVPDPVFAEGMAGDGLAVDPTGNVLHAPCEGRIVPMQGARHAVTLRTASGVDVLLHVGIDTVKLGGAGFELLVEPGQLVQTGEALLRFDLDLIARRAPSLITPVLIAAGGTIRRRLEHGPVQVGDFFMEVTVQSASAHASPEGPGNGTEELTRMFSVPFDHGLHARPAARMVAALRPFAAEVYVVSRGRSGNARSTVALMALGIQCGECIEVRATGAQAAQALDALASLLAAFVPPAETTPAPAPELPLDHGRVGGVVACRGVAIGQAVQLEQPELSVVETGGDAADEEKRLQAAIEDVHAHLETLARTAPAAQQSILAAHLELIQDPELAHAARTWIQRGSSAAHGWRQAARASIAALQALGDARMLERVADLRDLENQVLRVLAGAQPANIRQIPERAILIADELLPSQLMAVDRQNIAGICTARGGPTSHVAILAAAMGIPALVAAGPGVLHIQEGTLLVLDAEQGHLDIAPDPAAIRAVEQALQLRTVQNAADLATAQQACATTDQVSIAVLANLGSLQEVPAAVAHGAEGCGLLRTEFLFLERREAPGEDEQAREYQAIATGLGSRPLTIRTLDIGGDKPIPYLPLPHEDNPALGLRGLRTSLWRPALLRTQIRAILRVRPATQCRILLPMVTDADDVQIVRGVLLECCAELGLATAPALGIMIETPASALLANQLAAQVDFMSIGTNDLSQYVLAMDRGHQELAGKLDGLHPAVLRLIGLAAAAGHAHGKEVAVCGGLASDVTAIPILIGLGVRELSVVPMLIPRIKRIVRGLHAGACEALARQALEQPNAAAVRDLVERWPADSLVRPAAPAPQVQAANGD